MREKVDARAKLRASRLSDEQQKAVGQLVEAAAAESVEGLKDEMLEHWLIAISEVFEPDRDDARYRLGSRLLRMIVAKPVSAWKGAENWGRDHPWTVGAILGLVFLLLGL